MPSYETASSCSPSKRVRHRCKGHRANIWRRPGRSTVAHFARKVRGANIVADKHELKSNEDMPQSAGYIRYVFVALTLQAK